MDNDIGIAQVLRWRDEAQETLRKAQKLCTAAQSSLQKTLQDLAFELPRELESVEHLFDSYQNQFERIDKQIKNLKRILMESVDKVFIDIDSILVPSLSQLDSTITRLKGVTVPSFILNSTDTASKTLLDFIATDSIDLLKHNIDVYKTNCAKIKQLLSDEFQSRILNSYQQFSTQHGIVDTEFERLGPIQIEFRTAHGKILESKGVLGTTLQENQALENELVSLLQMLTNHFDQCNKAIELLSTSSSNVNVNIEVLANDAQELNEVFKDLTSIYDIVLTNETKSNKIYQQYSAYVDKSRDIIRSEMVKMRDFKVTLLPKFLILLHRSMNILQTCSITDESFKEISPCEIYSETIKSLVFHYTQFIEVYETKYLTELHHEEFVYPRIFLKKIRDFLSEDLYRIQLEETNRRKLWLEKYGELIPREFKLPGEDEVPVVVQVITEGLEQIQKEDGVEEFNDGEEKVLLDLIRSIKQK
ncbi:ATG17 [Candida theae]|uniref:Autophagy-related protein 17 n=1 Tax=Candida theae TaxID=1198502 RepID=A0AAD5BIW1_9ASCO|nr:ATG17 [Candida theae]KAI5967111.1 ATG17 [Candida theae]